jgi:AcrR family transcriptional regulator
MLVPEPATTPVFGAAACAALGESAQRAHTAKLAAKEADKRSDDRRSVMRARYGADAQDLRCDSSEFWLCCRPYMAASQKRARSKVVNKKTALPKSERRQQILSVARDVFARRGYHQTTIDDIALQAGVARGTFYLYFEDKRAVFSDLIDRFASQLTMAIVRIVTDDAQRPVVDQVRENIRAIIATCLMERSMTKILFTDAVGIDPAFDRKLFTFYDTVVQLLTESLKDGQALGIVDEGEPRVLAYLTIGALKELLYQAVTLGYSEESAEVLTQQMYGFLSGGYLRVGPSKTTSRPKRARL